MNLALINTVLMRLTRSCLRCHLRDSSIFLYFVFSSILRNVYFLIEIFLTKIHKTQ